MTMQTPLPPDSSYISDSTSAAELSRLLYQDRLLTEQMGGLLAEQDPATLTRLNRVLDVACGPGGWALDMAYAYQEVQITGIDISEPMVRYALTHASELGYTNVNFRVMDATRLLAFDDASFDLVNARLVSSFMPTRTWPDFLRECMRILRPGGTLRVTEFEAGMSNSPGHERMHSIAIQSMMRAGLSFSTDGRHLAILVMLGRLMKRAGVQNIQRKPFIVDYSTGEATHDAWYRDLLQLWKLVKPFALRTQVVTSQEYDQIYRQCMKEMQMENFCAIWVIATFWGEKPLSNRL